MGQSCVTKLTCLKVQRILLRVMILSLPHVLSVLAMLVLLGLGIWDLLASHWMHTQGRRHLMEPHAKELPFSKILVVIKDFFFLGQDHVGVWFSESGFEFIHRLEIEFLTYQNFFCGLYYRTLLFLLCNGDFNLVF